MTSNNQNTTKEQERAELYRAIWQIANDLRGNYVITNWNTITSKLTTIAGIIKNIDDQSQIPSLLDSKQSTNQYHIGIRAVLGEDSPISSFILCLVSWSGSAATVSYY